MTKRLSMAGVLELKDFVRNRDGMKCTDCGITQVEHTLKFGRGLDVHRVIPNTPYTVDGCVTLCRGCHGSKPKKPKYEEDIYRGRPRMTFDCPERLRRAVLFRTARTGKCAPSEVIIELLEQALSRELAKADESMSTCFTPSNAKPKAE